MFSDHSDSDARPLPSRIRVAQSYIEFCRGITEPCCGDDAMQTRRTLSPRELAAYDAAIETIRCYIVGELDLGHAPVTPAAAPGTAPVQTPDDAEEVTE
ncbi:MAG TPA: hypothetical protein VFF65_11055 [Phycisphaerales bacterium]|nr:hypothetical protein [Phycisphaerales bacterium]